MSFPTNAELRAASTTRLLAPYAQALAEALEQEMLNTRYQDLAQAMQIPKEKAAKVLTDVRTAARGWIPEADVYAEARRCLHDLANGLPHVPFLPMPSSFIARP